MALLLMLIIGVWGFLFAALVYGILFAIFRKQKEDFRKDSNENVIVSPVNGRVYKIEKNVDHEFFGKDMTSVLIQVPFWKEFGLFFPVKSEIHDVQASCDSCLDHLVKFRLVNGMDIGLAVGQNILRLAPQIMVLPGDRGKQKVNFGFLPMGGEVRVFIPSALEVLINEKDEVVAGQGILAGIPTDIEEK
ncbi:phosphatidylserine decarboxylase [Halobacteriovorax marinus]|uniref:hypothetical protein n=1 Tax=Halobacteriovorax marinus TaxID=97084 RepID=UPI0012FD2A72|nr:hypothetical protein [Halobacteriovorax marinus]